MEKISINRILEEDLRRILELLPKESHIMDVARTVVDYLGKAYPEEQSFANQKYLPLILLGKLGPALCYFYHFSRSGLRIQSTETTE